MVGQNEEVRVVHGLRHALALVSQLVSFPVFRTGDVENPQSPHDGKQLWRISGKFAYLMRALVDFSNLGGSKAPGRNERRPERELKRELLLKPLRALRQSQELFL